MLKQKSKTYTKTETFVYPSFVNMNHFYLRAIDTKGALPYFIYFLY